MMKLTNLFKTFVLIGVLIFSSCERNNSEIVVTEPVVQDALTVIHNRKSVRNFTGQKVSKDTLDILMKAGMAAPSARNKQPWAFVAISERAVLDSLAVGLPYAQMLLKAGGAIVVCAIPEQANDGKEEYAVIDCSCVSQNILLAAEAIGLGAVWTAVYPNDERESHVRKVLNIPDNIIPLNLIPVGYPTGEDQPKVKYKKENIKWEKWM